jgi:hypothetical protein
VAARIPALRRLLLLVRKALLGVADWLGAMAVAVVGAVVLEPQAAALALLAQQGARVEQVLRQQCLSTAQPTQVAVAVAEQWAVALVLVVAELVPQAGQLRTLLPAKQIQAAVAAAAEHQQRF